MGVSSIRGPSRGRKISGWVKRQGKGRPGTWRSTRISYACPLSREYSALHKPSLSLSSATVPVEEGTTYLVPGSPDPDSPKKRKENPGGPIRLPWCRGPRDPASDRRGAASGASRRSQLSDAVDRYRRSSRREARDLAQRRTRRGEGLGTTSRRTPFGEKPGSPSILTP